MIYKTLAVTYGDNDHFGAFSGLCALAFWASS